MNEAIELFEGAQDEDGYLDTKFELDLPAEKRFKGLRWSHELYTMGHFIKPPWPITGSPAQACPGHRRTRGELHRP
ncbi:MAG: hypothetical protein ACLRMR_08970 [Bifidobacterium pseudocatenulatum]